MMQLPIEYYHDRDDTAHRYRITPIMNNDIACDHLEWDKHGFKDEEVVARRNAKSFIDISTSESNEWRRDGQVGYHFC